MTSGKNFNGPSNASSIASSMLVLERLTMTFNLPITILEKIDLKITNTRSIPIATNILLRSIPNTPWFHTDVTKVMKFSIYLTYMI